MISSSTAHAVPLLHRRRFSPPHVILSEGRSPKSNPKGDATASGSPHWCLTTPHAYIIPQTHQHGRDRRPRLSVVMNEVTIWNDLLIHRSRGPPSPQEKVFAPHVILSGAQRSRTRRAMRSIGIPFIGDTGNRNVQTFPIPRPTIATL